MKSSWALPGSLVLAAALCVGLVWGVSWPLGVPGEWVWNRWPLAPDLTWNLITFGGWSALWLVVVFFGATRLDYVKTWERAVWLIVLGWLTAQVSWALQQTAPPEFRPAKLVWVLYYPGTSGYYTLARQESNTAELLRHYDELMSRGDVLHIGTHPPGLILGYHALIWLDRTIPAVHNWAAWSEPDDVRELWQIVLQNAGRSGKIPVETDHEVLWLAGCCMCWLCAATVWPLYGLLRRHLSPSASWSWASLWAWVPSAAIFFPKSDVSFPFWAALFLWLWLRAVDRRSLGWAASAGVALFLGLIQSLALLPVAFCGGVIALAQVWQEHAGPPFARIAPVVRQLWRPVAGAALGFGVSVGLFSWWGACSLPEIWWLNYRNHAGFYREYHRTYWAWLLVNPLELALGAGTPLAVAALWGVGTILRPTGKPADPKLRAIAGGCLLTWAILLLTGKNMGEAARLWIFLMPGLIWLAGTGLSRRESASLAKADEPLFPRYWGTLLLCQFIVALALVSRIGGFELHQG